MPMADAKQERPEVQLEQEVLEWADSVYDEAERELNQSREIRLCARLIDYINGQQWTAKARFGRSRPVINRVFRHFIEMAGLLTDIEPDFKVKFLNEDEAFSKLQDVLNELHVLWARMSDFEGDLTQVVMWALAGCTGWAKIQWNGNMFNGMGDNQFIELGPMNVMTIGAGRAVQDDECVISRWPVTIESLYRTYGDIAKGVYPDLDAEEGMGGDMLRPGNMAPHVWNRLPPTLRKIMGVKAPQLSQRSRYPKAMLKQFWFNDAKINETSRTVRVGDKNYNWSYLVEPGMPIYPRGRMLVVAGRKVLQDNCNPYWHSMKPYCKLRLLRVPWSKEGMTPLEPIALMSDVINRINGGIMDMIRAVIEPKIIAPKAAFSQSVWDSLDPGAPGAKMQFNNNTPHKPEMPKGPELPSYVLTMKQDVEKEQDASSGAAAISQAVAKKQVPGGDSLDMIMSSRSIPIRFMGRNLSGFLTEAGTMMTANKLQFETAGSRVKKLGAKGLVDNDFEPIYGQFINSGMQPEEFVRSVIFEIRKGSLLAIEKQDEVQVGFVLRKLGDVSRHALLRKLGLSNSEIQKIDAELMEEAQQKLLIAGAAGALQHKGGHK